MIQDERGDGNVGKTIKVITGRRQKEHVNVWNWGPRPHVSGVYGSRITCGRSNTIRKRYVWTEVFFKYEEEDGVTMSSVLESCTFNQPQQLSNQRIWKLTKTWIRRHCRCRHRFHDSLLIEIEPCPIKTFDGQDKPWTWSSPWNWTCSFRWTPGREDPHTSGPRLPSGVGSALSHWFSRPGKVSNEIQTKIEKQKLVRSCWIALGTGHTLHSQAPKSTLSQPLKRNIHVRQGELVV